MTCTDALMGRSEWSIRIENNRASYDEVAALVRLHNEAPFVQQGDVLRLNSIVGYRHNLYACLTNEAGRSLTSMFIARRIDSSRILVPLNKPPGWRYATVVWRCTNEHPTPTFPLVYEFKPERYVLEVRPKGIYDSELAKHLQRSLPFDELDDAEIRVAVVYPEGRTGDGEYGCLILPSGKRIAVDHTIDTS